MGALFVASLFLPIFWRFTLAATHKPSIHTRWDLAVFAIPLAIVAASYCYVAYSAGVYVMFIPIMLVTFWGPQLAVLGFFIWCDRENAGLSTQSKDPR